MPLSGSLAHLKLEISDKKWAESRRWVSSKYKLPKKQRTDGRVVASSKRLF
jgi:hypothetical protein